MPPTVVTTIVLIAMGLGILALTARAYLGSWDTPSPHSDQQARRTAAVDLEVRRLRQEITDYERRLRQLDDR